jgi:hypothetical protein
MIGEMTGRVVATSEGVSMGGWGCGRGEEVGVMAAVVEDVRVR